MKNNVVRKSMELNHEVAFKNDDIQNNLEEPSDLGIIISNATAKWTEAQCNNSIENINLNVRPGKLVAVIGPVGAGKVCIQSRTMKSNRQ